MGPFCGPFFLARQSRWSRTRLSSCSTSLTPKLRISVTQGPSSTTTSWRSATSSSTPRVSCRNFCADVTRHLNLLLLTFFGFLFVGGCCCCCSRRPSGYIAASSISCLFSAVVCADVTRNHGLPWFAVFRFCGFQVCRLLLLLLLSTPRVCRR